MATDPNSGLPRPTPEQQQAWAERYEREWLQHYEQDGYAVRPSDGEFVTYPVQTGLMWHLREFRQHPCETAYVFGCAPSLVGVDPPVELRRPDGQLRQDHPIVTVNNSWKYVFRELQLFPSVNVFLDTERFVEMAPEIPESIPVAAMFCPAKPVELMRRWFEVAEQLGDRFIPLRGTGQNGRMSNIDNGKLEPWIGMPVYAGSVIYIAIQIASMMTRKNVVILGVDMEWDGTQNHWDGVDRYVKKGAHDLWERTGRAAMIKLRDRLAADGIRLLKGTPGGKVDVLEEWHA